MNAKEYPVSMRVTGALDLDIKQFWGEGAALALNDGEEEIEVGN